MSFRQEGRNALRSSCLPDDPKEARNLKRFVTYFISSCVLLALGVWGTFAIAYSNISSVVLRFLLSWRFAPGSIIVLLFLRPCYRAVFVSKIV